MNERNSLHDGVDPVKTTAEAAEVMTPCRWGQVFDSAAGSLRASRRVDDSDDAAEFWGRRIEANERAAAIWGLVERRIAATVREGLAEIGAVLEPVDVSLAGAVRGNDPDRYANEA